MGVSIIGNVIPVDVFYVCLVSAIFTSLKDATLMCVLWESSDYVKQLFLGVDDSQVLLNYLSNDH